MIGYIKENIEFISRIISVTVIITFLAMVVTILVGNTEDLIETESEVIEYQIVADKDTDDTDSYYIKRTSDKVEKNAKPIEVTEEYSEETIEDSNAKNIMSMLLIGMIGLTTIYVIPYCVYQVTIGAKKKAEKIFEERRIEAEKEVKAKNRPEYQLRKFMETMRDILNIHTKIFKDITCFKTVLDKLTTIHTLAKGNDYNLSSMRTLVNVQLTSIEHLTASYIELSTYDAEESVKTRRQIEDTMNTVSEKLDCILRDIMEDDILNAQIEANVLQQISKYNDTNKYNIMNTKEV